MGAAESQPQDQYIDQTMTNASTATATQAASSSSANTHPSAATTQPQEQQQPQPGPITVALATASIVQLEQQRMINKRREAMEREIQEAASKSLPPTPGQPPTPSPPSSSPTTKTVITNQSTIQITEQRGKSTKLHEETVAANPPMPGEYGSLMEVLAGSTAATATSAVPSSTSSSTSATTNKSTHAESTLSYLDSISRLSSHHQHNVDVIAKQIEMLKENMKTFKEQRERRKMNREEQQHQDWSGTAMEDSAAPDSPSSDTTVSDDVELRELTSTTLDDDELVGSVPKKQKRDNGGNHLDANTVTPFAASAVSPTFPQSPYDMHQHPHHNVFTPPLLLDYNRHEFTEMRESSGSHDASGDAATTRMEDQEQEVDLLQPAPTPISIQMIQDSSPSSAATQATQYHPHNLQHPHSLAREPHSWCAVPTHKATPTQVSRVKLDRYLSDQSLRHLEANYAAGKISLDAVRYELLTIHHALEPEHEKELMEAFCKMTTASATTAVPVAISDATSSSSSSSSSTQQAPPTPSPVTPSGPSIIESVYSSLPQYLDTFSPNEPVEDDPDGIARLRVRVFMSSDQEEDYLGEERQVGSGGVKRKKSGNGEMNAPDVAASSSPPAAATTLPSVSNDSSAPSSPPTICVVPSTTSPPSSQRPHIMYRMMYVNRAFEHLTGFTQAQIRSFGIHGINDLDLTLRSDHYRAYQAIRERWRRERVRESIMYQVRSNRYGVSAYCLVHLKILFVKGRLHESVQSFMPLPHDPEYPAPPFVEGMDLEEATLLYGYKPPKKDETKCDLNLLQH